jgi:signal transduction histidine kinase
MLHFNPADIQTIGIGLAAFLSTLISSFIFLSASKERLGRAMGTMLAMIAVWSWFGFFYEIVSNIALARELRAVSVMGIVWLSMATINFALIYLEERRPIGAWEKGLYIAGLTGGAILTLLLGSDLFGTRFIVGDLTAPTNQVLAPHAGPLMAIVIVYYAFCIALSAVFFALRARAGKTHDDRRQAEIIFASLTVALVLGGTRFAPWYGFDFMPVLGGLGAPLFAYAAFYSIKRYQLLNLQVAVAQLLIFAIWTFTFFRILLSPSLKGAVPDIILFIAVLILGFSLLRSIVIEIRTQKELARLTIEHAKSEFITVAAHQLRTPLTAIRWTLNLLANEKGPGLPGEQTALVAQGKSAAENMVLIVNNLLNAERMTKGTADLTLEAGDLREILKSSEELFIQPAKEKNLIFTVSVPATALSAKFDQANLSLAIQNLIDNAIKYTPSGGTVLVRAVREGNTISIKVSDTGIGITPADQPHLFEKFFRSPGAVRMVANGSGLGLFIAKSIVEGHGGTLTLQPRQGGGTDALITLPA